MGGPVIGSDAPHVKLFDASGLVAPCPHLKVVMGGIEVPCLLDTGSMVSTITEGFFRQHFEPWGQERLKACNWLQLRVANGLDIPYLGYLELNVELCEKVMHCGVLIVRSPWKCLPSGPWCFGNECDSQML